MSFVFLGLGRCDGLPAACRASPPRAARWVCTAEMHGTDEVLLLFFYYCKKQMTNRIIETEGLRIKPGVNSTSSKQTQKNSVQRIANVYLK